MVWGLGFRVWGLGFEVSGLRVTGNPMGLSNYILLTGVIVLLIPGVTPISTCSGIIIE